jgi:DNA-binding PucR family transcriptional regulator
VNIADRLQPLIEDLVRNDVPLQLAIETIREKYIRTAKDMCGGNVTRAARKLGVHRNTLMNRVPSERALRMRERRARRGR